MRLHKDINLLSPNARHLAEEIDAALVGQGTGRRPVPVDLGELAAPLQGGPSGGGLLDLTTGEVWPSELFDDPFLDVADLELPDVDEDPDRWLELPIPTSRDGCRDMRDFAEDLPQPAQQRLLNAIDGPGAFARFRREVDRAGEDLRDQWLEFRENARSAAHEPGSPPGATRSAPPETKPRASDSGRARFREVAARTESGHRGDSEMPRRQR